MRGAKKRTQLRRCRGARLRRRPPRLGRCPLPRKRKRWRASSTAPSLLRAPAWGLGRVLATDADAVRIMERLRPGFAQQLIALSASAEVSRSGRGAWAGGYGAGSELIDRAQFARSVGARGGAGAAEAIARSKRPPLDAELKEARLAMELVTSACDALVAAACAPTTLHDAVRAATASVMLNLSPPPKRPGQAAPFGAATKSTEASPASLASLASHASLSLASPALRAPRSPERLLASIARASLSPSPSQSPASQRRVEAAKHGNIARVVRGLGIGDWAGALRELARDAPALTDVVEALELAYHTARTRTLGEFCLPLHFTRIMLTV